MPRQPHRRSSGPPATPPRNPASHKHREPKMAVLAAANRLRDQANTPGRNVSGTLGQAPLVVESQRYEEWMKIATDNKITSTNTWNLALIDYFHDMSLLRDGADNSINFQKASCTLDGCVKIWTSRVDSVATETGKLLSGLGDDAPGGGDDNEDGDGDEDDERQEKRARKRAARQAATLADDFSKLRVKSFDLEFTVDPLFKKTSADFDEGGAGGILMNHLACDGTMKVVFDAGDAKLECDEEDALEELDEEDKARQRAQDEEDRAEIDISKLQARCLPNGTDPLSHMSLCPSLSAFRFSADAQLDLGLLNLHDDSDGDDRRYGAAAAGPDAPVDDGDFGGFDAGMQDFGGGFDDDSEGGGGGGGGGADDAGEVDFFADQFAPVASGSGAGAGGAGGGGGGFGFGAVEAFDPRRAADERDLVMAMDAGGGDDGLLFEHFDAKLGRNWAGPEHWKMRRGVAAGKQADDGAAPAPRVKKDKVAFSLDFSGEPPVPIKELFAAAAPKSSITTAATKATTAAGRARKSSPTSADDDFTLPDDFHFNSQNLLRLFLKPKTTLKMRRRGGVQPQLGLDGAEGDVQFWAQAGAGGAGGPGGEDGYGGGMDTIDFPGDFGGGGGDDDGDDFPPPFDTQWLAEDTPDAHGANGSGPGGADDDEEMDDLHAATQGQLRRVRPEMVSYAKRAKRVDVKKLKDSIWRELEEVVIPVKQFPSSHAYDAPAPPADDADPSADTAAAARKPKPPRRKREALIPVVSRLRAQYPKDKMDEISTSYMFICLLHLANEKGLRIQVPKGDDDDELRKVVGGLEGLRVLKEVA
ncbi:uncharacterized protein RHOBADRAFT_55260 [Rhodotorula graminis WP1]|uniref:Condensin complex subunit 2 n=1 Tax=Rhodotorula graminis (strain WP1) TaxID=578459 RepID=A0A0P9IUD0_RHOGW|nr:uncharacterized protein RHOBADRAFT_55260 [Rhodotorula graminis WP1]KPV73018.1 hypothetical protein RHOBADRAFT_55260 [Rhodotorula graminis WP1]